MKRSDFLKELYDSVDRFHDSNSTQNMVDYLLDECERLGMRPPRVSEEDAQALMHVYYGGYSLNQWDEDLAKDEKVADMKQRRHKAKEVRMARRRSGEKND
jgi:hypothetical protein